MSQTTSSHYATVTVSSSLDLETYQGNASLLQEQIIMIGLLCGLYGVLTILSITSVYALIIRRRRIQPTTVMLSFTTLSLFTSTTVFVVASILQCQLLVLYLFTDEFVWLYNPPILLIQLFGGELPQYYSKAVSLAQSCASPATLTINVVLGDAIVWWRTCVIWNNGSVVRAVGCLSMLATLGLGVISAIQSCRPLVVFGIDSFTRPLNLLGTSLEGLPLGIAACALSLGSNVFTTLLVAYKAWQSRRRLRKYLVAKASGSPVEKVLTLLIESGAIYSAIWAVVIAYQVGDFKKRGYPDSPFPSKPTAGLQFLFIFGIMINGALVPVIAIYPAIIIVLVALNSSHMERALTQNLESFPTPCIDHTVNTTTTSLHESRLNRRSEVLVIGVQRQELTCEDVDNESGIEGASRCTSEESKGKGVIRNFQPNSNE